MKNFLFTTFFLLLLPSLVQAFSAEIIVDTGRENINALEATVHIPQGVNIEKIYTGNSIILFWIKSPIYDNQSQTISFSGITPGGFSGKKTILSFSGKFTAGNLPRFSFSEINALKNDGLGTNVPVKLDLVPTEVAEDQVSPEPFDLSISSSPNVFDGQRFLTFATQDKGTGIGRYEYASSWFLSPDDDDWLETKSPMVLSREMLFQKIYVRAIDNSENYRIVSIAGPYHYASLFIGIIILLCISLYLRYLVSRRYSSSSLSP